MRKYKFFANLIMVLHFAFIALLVGGTIFVVSHAHRWYIPWHLSIITGTLLLNLFMGSCPLTVWEEKLRKKYDSSANLNNAFLETYLRALLGVDLGKGFVFWLTFLAKLGSYTISILLLTVFK